MSPLVRWAGTAALALVAALTLGTVAALALRAEPGRGLGPAEWAALQVHALAGAAVGRAELPRRRCRRRGRWRGGGSRGAGCWWRCSGRRSCCRRSSRSSASSRSGGGPGSSAAGWRRRACRGSTSTASSAWCWRTCSSTSRWWRGCCCRAGWRSRPRPSGWRRSSGSARGTCSGGSSCRCCRSVLPGAFVLVFLLCMTSFAVALTLGGGPRATTVELAIYQALRFDFDLGRAAWLALIQFALCGSGGARRAAAVGRRRLRGRGRRRGRALGRRPARDARRSTPRCSSRWRCSSGCRSARWRRRGWRRWRAGCRARSGWRRRGASRWRSPRRRWRSGSGWRWPRFVDARRARGGGRLAEAAGLMTLAASPFVIGTGLFILLFPIADPFALALPVTATVNAAMALPFVLRALLPALAETRRRRRPARREPRDARLDPVPAGDLGAAPAADGLRGRARGGAQHGRPRGDRALRAAGGGDAAAPDAAADGGLPDGGGGRGRAGAGGADLRALLGVRSRRAGSMLALERDRGGARRLPARRRLGGRARQRHGADRAVGVGQEHAARARRRVRGARLAAGCSGRGATSPGSRRPSGR